MLGIKAYRYMKAIYKLMFGNERQIGTVADLFHK